MEETMKNVLIVFGSMTPEHDLSCKSAATIVQAIDREKYNPMVVGITGDGKWFYTESTPEEIASCTEWETSPTNRKAVLDPDHGAKKLLIFEKDGSVRTEDIDIVFARIAGNTGEDGKLQGLFEIAGIPYVGCGVMSSACSMDKMTSYLFADSIGLRRPMTQIVFREDYEKDKDGTIAAIRDDLIKRAGYPIFVKPVATGSSVGITKAHEESELKDALDKACSFGRKVVLEENISGAEIKVGVLGNDAEKIGAICELLSNGDWNDFSTKYVAHSSTKNIPADFDKETEDMIKEATVKIYRALECRGFSRVDFFLTEDNELVFNEINTMPGFKPESVYPELFTAIGMSYTDLITELLETAGCDEI